MKTFNKIFLSTIVMMTMLFSITSCDDDKPNRKSDSEIERDWELKRVANIADADKILGSTLVLKSGGEYLVFESDGTLLDDGEWTYTNGSLMLSHTLFGNGGTPEYKVLLLDADNLHLQEHYTLDGKDAYLEYHFEPKEE